MVDPMIRCPVLYTDLTDCKAFPCQNGPWLILFFLWFPDIRVDGFVSDGYAELVEQHVRPSYLESCLVGIEVTARHACQQDFLIVTTGENFAFINQESLFSLHIR